jgi:hypothetical protein
MTADTGKWEYDEERFNRALEEMERHARASEQEQVREKLTWDGPRYWGVWHPVRGWISGPGGIVWYTTFRPIAEAQVDVVRRWWASSSTVDPDLWEVREIGGQGEQSG